MAFRVFNLETGRSMVSGFQWGSDSLHILFTDNVGEVGTQKNANRQNTFMKFKMEDIDNGETIPAGSVFTLAQFQTKASAIKADGVLSFVGSLVKKDGVWNVPNTDGVWRVIKQSRLDDEIDIFF